MMRETAFFQQRRTAVKSDREGQLIAKRNPPHGGFFNGGNVEKESVEI
jgi:hypothetical protein